MRIVGAPKIRQIYWCDFDEPPRLPEFGKTRPVLILSFKNFLTAHSTVLPITTDDQEGKSADWAHALQQPVTEGRLSWVVCNHIYTVSNTRLSPFGQVVPRLSEDEFNDILAKVLRWLPSPSD